MSSLPYRVMKDGTVELPEGPGIGIEIDDKFLEAHAFIPGRNFV